jgi:hypothetical protein
LKKCLLAIFLLSATGFAASNQQATKTLILMVVSAPTITTATLPSAVVGQAYSTTLLASGGDMPYVWSVGDGLPSGLSLTTAGALSGTVLGTACPTGTCNFSATFSVTDSVGNVASATLTLKVASAFSITTASLPTEYVNVGYSATLTAAGGVAPYTWSASAGLPAGLTLSSAGVLSGTVSSSTCTQPSCSYTFTVTATDASGSLARISIVTNSKTSAIKK